MENKFQAKNIFESSFDSFELSDGFLLKLDADLKKNSLNKKKLGDFQKIYFEEAEKKIDKSVDKNSKYDLSLFIEDFDESDFFGCSKSKTHSLNTKVCSNEKDRNEKKSVSINAPTTCLSPMLCFKSFNQANMFSSTPIKPNDTQSENQKSSPKSAYNTQKTSEFDFLEADLFDDWNLEEINKGSTQKETVTLSQALKLVEEAKSSRELNQKQTLNESIDLLTGEIVGADVEDLFAQSFHLMKSADKRQNSEEKDFSSDNSVVIENIVGKCKPSAAHKLNFDSENTDFLKSDSTKEKEKDFKNISFSSEDDFNFVTQDLIEKGNKNLIPSKPYQNVPDLVKIKKNCDLNESGENIVKIKKRKCYKIVESDTAVDSPSPKFKRQNKTKKKKRQSHEAELGRNFLDFEAEVSEKDNVSSDEVDEEGEYDRSFLDEESYSTQNLLADMTAEYLQSIKGFHRSGTFKIPATKPYNPETVFSQIPEENNTDYEIDSFCVNDVEYEAKSELSDLEIAEKILEMESKKGRKKRLQKSRKIT